MQTHEISERHKHAALSEWSGGKRNWNLLLTGRDLNACMFAGFGEFFDRRRHTGRFRLWIPPGADADAELSECIEQAKLLDMTLQLLCVFEPIDASAETHNIGGGASVTVRECHEEYPVLNLGSHGWKYPTVK